MFLKLSREGNLGPWLVSSNPVALGIFTAFKILWQLFAPVIAGRISAYFITKNLLKYRQV